jgi:hypothetical protein
MPFTATGTGKQAIIADALLRLLRTRVRPGYSTSVITPRSFPERDQIVIYFVAGAN